MGKFQVISHPLIQHKLSILRRTSTSTKDFRELVNEIAMLMGYEVCVTCHLKMWRLKRQSLKQFRNKLQVKN